LGRRKVTQSAKVFHCVKAINAVVALLNPRRMQASHETTIVINIHRWGGYEHYPSNMGDLKREEVLFQPSHFIAELHHVLVLCLPNAVHLVRT